MRLNKWFVGVIILFLCASCIEEFTPKIDETREMLVINGHITDVPGIHSVSISMSSAYNDPQFRPVSGCVVRIEDEKGRGITFNESTDGIYESLLDQDFLAIGKSYKLLVFTPDGNEYQSDYDSLLVCAPIDKLSYQIEKEGTSNPDINYYGVRFLVDVSGGLNDARNYLWTFEETWEYAATYFTQYIWDGDTLIEFVPYDLTASICYFTLPIKDLYVGTSRLYETNEISKHPIHYVSNQTPRLLRRYSLLVSQHSLSDRAFLYWDQVRKQSGETGGLYETQPVSITGNIFNINDPEETVLGFFFASQIQKKRIDVEKNLTFQVAKFSCPVDTVSYFADLGLDFPYHLYSINVEVGKGPPYIYSYKECHDCRLRGGTTTKPEFWTY